MAARKRVRAPVPAGKKAETYRDFPSTDEYNHRKAVCKRCHVVMDDFEPVTREAFVDRYMQTRAGRATLLGSMVEPLRRAIEEQRAGHKYEYSFLFQTYERLLARMALRNSGNLVEPDCDVIRRLKDDIDDRRSDVQFAVPGPIENSLNLVCNFL